MRKLLFALSMILLCSFCSFAQNARQGAPAPAGNATNSGFVAAHRAEAEARRYTKHYQSNYQLNEEQTKKTYETNLACFKKLLTEKNAAGNDWTVEERNTILAERDTQLKAFFTKEQFTKFQSQVIPNAMIR
jgi:hypothetical protein